MRRYQKILALTLVGTGAFMLSALPVQAAAVEASDVQISSAVHGLQKVTAVTHIYGSGEQVAEAILEYPQSLLPSAVKPTDFAVSGKEITAVMVNDKPELTNKTQAGRYVILQFAKQNNVYDGDLSQKPGHQAKPADDKNGQSTDAPRQSNRKLPDLFAAQWLVARQWNVEEMAAIKDKKLWITVCEGDIKAFPGMNAATALWESLGSKVARNETFWNSHASLAEINANVKDMAAANAPINYSVFAGGNHMYTWSFAYDIEAIRDWLFQQRKDGQQHSLLAKALQDVGLAAYNAGDYKKALANFTAANNKGHMKAPRYIGLCYEHGYGVTANTKEAAKWYAIAAERGDITGTYYLGRLFETGNGVPQDYNKAFDLYQKAAQRGDIIAAPAMAALGHLYETGLGVEKNLHKAQE